MCVALTVIVPFSICFGEAEEVHHEPDSQGITYDSDRPMLLSRIAERYDFDWIGEYFDEYYIGRYKYWEGYLTSKQREFAGKFGLSDIYFKPDFSRYDRTKIALTKKLWENKIDFRYLAPVGDLRDCEFSFALRPHKCVTFVMRCQMDGEQSLALVINRPLGSDKDRAYAANRLRRFLRQLNKYTR